MNLDLDINIYSINNKIDHISEKYIFYRKKSWYFPDFRSDLEQDPDPLFHRIRIHIKMKRIRNTDKYNHILDSDIFRLILIFDVNIGE